MGAIDSHLPDHLHPNSPPLPANYCGSCYGAEAESGECCNSCEDVRNAYRLKGWVMPDYDGIEQCQREGFQDSLLAVVCSLRPLHLCCAICCMDTREDIDALHVCHNTGLRNSVM